MHQSGRQRKMPVMPVFIIFLAFVFVFRIVDVVEKSPEIYNKLTVTSFKPAEAKEEDKNEEQQNLEPLAHSRSDDVFAPVDVPDRSFIGGGEFSSSELGVLQSLAKRREELRQQEVKLKQKEALLEAATKQLENKMEELSALKAEIQNLLQTQQTEQQERIKSLVKMYETMKPKDAADILNTLDMDVLVNIIGQMSERRAAPILASMESKIAREVTLKLVDQKKLPDMQN